VNDVITPILAKLARGADLHADEVGAAASEILEGRASDIEIAGFIVALRTKGETTTELAALVRSMLQYATAVDAPAGVIDTCGTGGDRAGTVNVSTMAAIIAAGAGAKVVKHGNRAASSECGSADVLEALGIPIELGPDAVARCVEEAGIGFCFAPRYHPALRFVGPVRRELGIPTTFNFLGPLANPARVRRQCVGVSDPAMAERVLAVLVENGAERAMVFHGDDGLDELTTTSTSRVYEYFDGEFGAHALDPLEFGIPRANPDDLRGGNALQNADALRRVVDGERGPLRDMAVLNAAAAIAVAGITDDLPSSLAAASQAIDSGAARKCLDTWIDTAKAAADSSQAAS
jgi:anthranilate phosphoribosyltransferase